MLKTVTYEQVLDMHPCWLDTPTGCRRLKRYADRLGGKATALDILRLNRIPADDRLWIVLRDEVTPVQVLHEFACRCAERALARIDHPDPRSVAAIKAKRQWLDGLITSDELDAAWRASLDVATSTCYADLLFAATSATTAAGRDARVIAENTAICGGKAAAWAKVAAWDKRDVIYAAERKAQIDMLIEMLLEEL